MEYDDLTISGKLCLDSLADGVIFPSGNYSINRFFRGWWGSEKGDFLESGESKMKAPGYRGRRKGKDIDMRFHFFYGFFLDYTKTMFFIDDKKSETTETNIFRKKTMSPYNDIDRSKFHFFENFFHFRCMSHTSQ